MMPETKGVSLEDLQRQMVREEGPLETGFKPEEVV